MTTFRNIFSPRRAKTAFAMALFLLCAASAFAEINVTRAKINGLSPRMFRNSWAEFECYVENTDSKPHTVEVRVRPSEEDSQTSFFSGEIRIPGKTKTYLRFPVQVETADSHSIDVKSDGVKLPNNVYNDTPIQLMNYKARSVCLLNDSDDSLGSFTQFPSFKDKLYTRNYSARYAPRDRRLYEMNDAIFVCKPDFQSYSQEQFNAILSYVAEGGKLIFFSPQAVRDAANTPLSVLLPVDPVVIRRTDRLPIGKFIPEFDPEPGWETDFLVATERDRGVTLLSDEGLPLIREAQYGLGMVKTVLFSVNEKSLGKNQNSAMERILTKLISAQDLYPNRKLFTDTLDKLTGFKIPGSAEIIHILMVYLIVFFSVLILGMIFRRSGLAWFVSAVFACVMVAVILQRSTKSFAHRQSVLAEISVNLPRPYPVGETYASCFSVTEQAIHAKTLASDSLFSAIPTSPRINIFFTTTLEQDLDPEQYARAAKPSVRIVSPVEIFRAKSGAYSVRSLSIAPRTSKQFMAYHTPTLVSDAVPSDPEPELLLSDKGIELVPYKVPENLLPAKPESVWLVMPGGIRQLGLNEKGEYHLSGSAGIFIDSVAKSVMESLCMGLRKPMPYLAFVSGVRKNFIQLANPMAAQGKRITMIPARLTITTRNVKIPEEFLVLSPGNTSARTFFQGNTLVGSVPLMTGQVQNPLISLPGPLSGIFVPETLRIDVDCSVSDSVELLAYLTNYDPAGERLLEGKKTDGNVFEFTRGLSRTVSPSGNFLELNLEPKMLADPIGMSPEQAMRANHWNLRNIAPELTGSIDASLALPLKF